MSVRFAEQEGEEVIDHLICMLPFPLLWVLNVVLLRAEGRLKHMVVLEVKGFIPDLQISDGASLSLRP